MQGEEDRPAPVARPQRANVVAATRRTERSAFGVLDAVMFLGVLLFSAVAVLAIALAAPLLIAVSAMAAAFSGETVRGGWRVVRTV